MSRKLMLALVLLSSLGCFSLEPFYYRNTRLDEYLREENLETYPHYRGIIPRELISPVTYVSDGDTIYGFWALRQGDLVPIYPPVEVVTVLYHHGNYENINNYWDRVELLWELGYRVFIYDYPGFGRSQGEPSSQGCYDAARGALDEVLYNSFVDTSRIVYYGYSLGGYMATWLAAEVRTPRALILESTPASTDALFKDSGILGLPGGVVSGDDYDNESRIGDVGCPLLMMHGKADDYVVFERHAPVLWELATEPKDSFWVQDAGHSDLPWVAGEAYGEKIEEFLDTHIPQ